MYICALYKVSHFSLSVSIRSSPRKMSRTVTVLLQKKQKEEEIGGIKMYSGDGMKCSRAQ